MWWCKEHKQHRRTDRGILTVSPGIQCSFWGTSTPRRLLYMMTEDMNTDRMLLRFTALCTPLVQHAAFSQTLRGECVTIHSWYHTWMSAIDHYFSIYSVCTLLGSTLQFDWYFQNNVTWFEGVEQWEQQLICPKGGSLYPELQSPSEARWLWCWAELSCAMPLIQFQWLVLQRWWRTVETKVEPVTTTAC